MHRYALVVMGLCVTYDGLGNENEDWSNIHVPLRETRVHCPREFNPQDPVIVVTCSNTSPSHGINIPVPVTDVEKVILVPEVRFDGVRPPFRDEQLLSHDILPRHGAWIPPMSERSVSYTMSRMFRIPPQWHRMEVIASENLELVGSVHVFDRTGALVGRRTNAVVSLEAKRASLCRIPRIRKAVLEDTVWSNMVRRMPDLTNALPVPGPEAAPEPVPAATNASTADQPSVPIPFSGSESNVRRRSVPTGFVAVALGLLVVGALGWVAVRWRKRG